MMKNRFFAVTGILVAAVLSGSTSIHSQEGSTLTVEERLNQLEQKQEIMEQRWENTDIKAKEAAKISADGKDGFVLKAANSAFALKMTGYAQIDYRAYLNDDAHAFADQFLLRKARPTFDGVMNKSVDFRIQSDFGGTSPTVQDAYVDLHYWPQFRLKLGKFKFPLFLEALQNDTAGHFVERGHPSGMATIRDVGAQLGGDIGVLNYAMGVFNGGADGTSPNSDTGDNKDFVARVFIHPFQKSYDTIFKQLGLGAAGSVGIEKGTVASPNLASYKDTAQLTFFTFRSDVVADGDRIRFSPQAYWYVGPLGVLGEYASSSQEVKRATTTTTRTTLTNVAWQVAAVYIITGEKASYKGLKVQNPFDPAKKTWGALEIVGRYTVLTVDLDAFTRYADPAKSAQRARSWTGGLNWYLNNNVKLMSDYEYTSFTGRRATDRAILSRLQVAF